MHNTATVVASSQYIHLPFTLLCMGRGASATADERAVTITLEREGEMLTIHFELLPHTLVCQRLWWAV